MKLYKKIHSHYFCLCNFVTQPLKFLSFLLHRTASFAFFTLSVTVTFTSVAKKDLLAYFLLNPLVEFIITQLI